MRNVHTGMFSSTTYNKQREDISSRFSSNSEAVVSELPENLEGMSCLYYKDSDVISRVNSSITHRGVTRDERVKRII